MGPDAVGRFFCSLWGSYCRDSLDLELVEVPADRLTRSVVFWDQGVKAWRVLADSRLQGRDLLWVLFHELGHVTRGHAKKTDLPILRHVRSMLVGGQGKEADALRVALRQQAGKAEQKAQEAEAEAFAEAQVERWWSVLETIDRTVKLTVSRHFEGG